MQGSGDGRRERADAYEGEDEAKAAQGEDREKQAPIYDLEGEGSEGQGSGGDRRSCRGRLDETNGGSLRLALGGMASAMYSMYQYDLVNAGLEPRASSGMC